MDDPWKHMDRHKHSLKKAQQKLEKILDEDGHS